MDREKIELIINKIDRSYLLDQEKRIKNLLVKHVQELFRLYPEVLEGFCPENMTREQIIEFISIAINTVLANRKVNTEKYFCLTSIDYKYRSHESLLLLLFLGFKLNKAIDRIVNSHQKEGGIFISSAGDDVVRYVGYEMPRQEYSKKYSEFIDTLVDPESSYKLVDRKYSALVGDVLPRNRGIDKP